MRKRFSPSSHQNNRLQFRLKNIFVLGGIGLAALLVLFQVAGLDKDIEIHRATGKIIPNDGLSSDFFAKEGALAISGDFAIIGAPGRDTRGSMSGAAYIFRKSATGWIQESKLIPEDLNASSAFGQHVAISGDYVIVGAAGDNTRGPESGAAYIYQRRGTRWLLSVKLTPKDGEAYDNFGQGVAIDGNYAAVGAYGNDQKGTNSGAVYFYELNKGVWLEISKATAKDGEANDYFGREGIAIDGNFAIISAYGDDDGGENAGAAYIFERVGNGWEQYAKLVGEDLSAGDYLGRYGSVAISKDWALVGAYGDDEVNRNAGAAYLFHYQDESWELKSKLLAPDGKRSDFFGRFVALCGANVVIGAHGVDDNGSFSGAAYLFQQEGDDWMPKGKMIPEDAQEADFVGRGLALDQNMALVGAFGDDENGPQSGSAYFFQLLQPGQIQSVGSKSKDNGKIVGEIIENGGK